MKLNQRILSLALALAMLCALRAGAAAAGERQEIEAYLSHDITVQYNGEVQALKDAAGNPVCPVSCNDTTYLPVRAVGNMLGVTVGWDEETRTVFLEEPRRGRNPAGDSAGADGTAGGQEEVRVFLDPGISVWYNGAVQTLTDAAGNPVYPVSYNDSTYLPIRAVGGMLGVEVDWEEETRTVLLRDPTSIVSDWAEIDWSAANDGYVSVLWKERTTDSALCTVRTSRTYRQWYLPFGEWVKIPLASGSGDYTVVVRPTYNGIPEEEIEAAWREELRAQVKVEIADPEAISMMSNVYVDFERVPEAQAKALELTQDCGTEAEKVAAVFTWVSRNIAYDFELVETEKAAIAAGAYSDASFIPPRDLNLDHILDSGKGVCEHTAVLVAGMLRSLGIPCRVVSGSLYTGQSWEGHAWVAVRPADGELDMASLGAGMEPDGEWVRLDPTNGLLKPEVTVNDRIYRSNYYY